MSKGNTEEKNGNGTPIASRVGDFLDRSIGNTIQSRNLEPPVLQDDPEPGRWYRVPLSGCVSGDGSGYHIYTCKGTGKDLCIILSGGGVAWNEYTAARPVTGGKVIAGLPNFYWNNLRPLTQLMNINIGITDIKNRSNPFSDWSFVVITYATGDFHVGDSDFPYTSEEGEEKVLHFRGRRNFEEAMKFSKRLFPNPRRLLVAGNSAGAFAVPALAGRIEQGYYGNCDDITLFSDSGLLLYEGWNKTARDIWKAEDGICDAIHSDNPTVDWYEDLHERYGDRFRYLYASSTRDYLLSAYYNDIVNKEFRTDKDVQQIFFSQLVAMTEQLDKITNDFHYYFFDWPMLPLSLGKGGTVHTALKEITFCTVKQNGKTMAEWLMDQVNGIPYDVGRDLLDR